MFITTGSCAASLLQVLQKLELSRFVNKALYFRLSYIAICCLKSALLGIALATLSGKSGDGFIPVTPESSSKKTPVASSAGCNRRRVVVLLPPPSLLGLYLGQICKNSECGLVLPVDEKLRWWQHYRTVRSGGGQVCSVTMTLIFTLLGSLGLNVQGKLSHSGHFFIFGYTIPLKMRVIVTLQKYTVSLFHVFLGGRGDELGV